MEIVRDFKLPAQEPGLLEVALANSTNSAGAEAMRLVMNGPRADLVRTALAGASASAAVEVLGNTAEKAIVPLLEPIVTDTTRGPELRRRAVKALARVEDGAAALVEMARDRRLPEDLRLVTGTELSKVRWEPLKRQGAELLPPPPGQNGAALPPVSELIQMKGDAQKGKLVFRRETPGCSKCHQVNGEGTDFGPGLSEIGAKMGKEAILESILDPSAGISFGYEAWQITLNNDDEVYGLIQSETADEVAIKTVGGTVTRCRKADIIRRTQQKISAMPTGLQQTMSTQELVDLLEYLAGLGKPAKP
jgi:putative heme-binding domain-containing protein